MAATIMDCDTDFCSIHNSEKYKYYCYTCQRLICFVCLSGGGHKKHEFDDLNSSFYEQLKTNIQQLVDDIRQVEVATDESLLSTEKQEKLINEWFFSTRSQIDEFFLQSVSEVVNDKERELKDSLEKETNQHTQYLQSIKEECDDATRSCQECRQSVDEDSLLTRLREGKTSSVAESVSVIAKIAEVNKRVKTLLSSPRPSRDDLKFVDIDLHADEAHVEAQIGKLGQLTPQTPITGLDATDSPGAQLTFPDDALDSDTYTIPGPAIVRNRSGSENENLTSNLSDSKGIILHPDKLFPYLSDEGASLEPFGVCCAWNNGVAVSSTSATSLPVFSVNGELLKIVKRKFNRRTHVTYYSSKHKLICIDCNEHGKCQLVKIKSGILQETPYELSLIASPGGVAMEMDDRKPPALFVTDSTKSVIHKLDTQGRHLYLHSNDDRLLAKPMGIAYTQGCVVVCNYDDNSIVKLSTSNWSKQWRFDQLSKPFGVATDAQGYLYVTESEKHRISIFDNTGNLLTHFGRKGSNPGMFDTPRGIAITEDDAKIVVADSGNCRLQVFSRDYILNSV